MSTRRAVAFSPVMQRPNPWVAPTESFHDESNAFNLIRLVAATGVLISHSFALSGLDQPRIFGGRTLGEVCVHIFFVVSGYLVCQSWTHDPHPGRFTVRRGLRLAPGLVVAVLLTTLLVGVIASSLPVWSFFQSPATWAYVLSNISFTSGIEVLPGAFADNPFPRAVNGSLWSLRYEVIMYAALVAMGVTISRRHIRWGSVTHAAVFVSALMLASWAASNAIARWPIALPGAWRIGLEIDLLQLAELAGFFFAGCLLYSHRLRVPLSGPVASLTILACLLFDHSPLLRIVLWFALPYAVVAAAMKLPPALRMRGWPDYSYGIYIYAFPVQQLVAMYTTRAGIAGWWVPCLLALPPTFLLAAFSWHCVENPALRLKRLLRRPRAMA